MKRTALSRSWSTWYDWLSSSVIEPTSLVATSFAPGHVAGGADPGAGGTYSPSVCVCVDACVRAINGTAGGAVAGGGGGTLVGGATIVRTPAVRGAERTITLPYSEPASSTSSSLRAMGAPESPFPFI